MCGTVCGGKEGGRGRDRGKEGEGEIGELKGREREREGGGTLYGLQFFLPIGY